MTKRILREVYDIWGYSLGWVMATVPADFQDGVNRPLPPRAPKQYFATSAEAQEEGRRLMSEPPEDGRLPD
jgi:hypothetical protein